MKDRQPWSVRGVTREARAKAARAASQQHMTIGEWVTRTLIEAADRDLGLAPETPSESQAGTANLPAKASDQQRELTRALGDLVQYLEKTARTNDVGRRLERTEHALMGRMEQMAAGLYSLMQTMETRTMPVVDVDTGSTRLMLPDQSRLAAAVEQMVDAETKRQDQMAAVADALTKLVGRVGGAGAMAVAAAAEPQSAAEAEEPVVDVLELGRASEDEDDDILELDDEVGDEPVAEIPPRPTPLPAAAPVERGPAGHSFEPTGTVSSPPRPRPIGAPVHDEAEDDEGGEETTGTEDRGVEAPSRPKPIAAEADEDETDGDGASAAAETDTEPGDETNDEAEDDDILELDDEEEETSETGDDEDDTSADDEGETKSSAAATASWIASGRRDRADDVVASIRARSINRSSDDDDGEEHAKRGLFGRLFRRD